jgi:hypothetical protein
MEGPTPKEKKLLRQINKLGKQFRSSIFTEYLPMLFIVLLPLLIIFFIVDKISPSTTDTDKVIISEDYKCPMDYDNCEKSSWTDTQDYETYIDSEIGFSFEYPNHLFIGKDPEIPNMLIIMPERLKTTNELFTSITITVEENSNSLTPFEWIKQEAVGSNRPKPFDVVDMMKEYFGNYQVETIDGQQAVFMDGGLWAVVNTPNQKWRISISPLLDIKSGARVLFKETEVIINSLSFIEPEVI